ncbi:MAG: hypothetical protein M1820_007712 [Bogoriella megaspora]|nr:MAG: hypothetical protein M1820_007712 [Bogoriella megaspora]
MGLKDILKPIRDRLDDLMPTPTPDRREWQHRQQREALKGFAYFESFEELHAWSTEDVDPLQVSNTLLISRAPLSKYGKATITLIHDYAGNYKDYESCQGFDVSEENYCCEYLQYVDAFVYFSHKLVCVPPPTWTNTLHRNGVKSLGTFIIEPGSCHVEKILQSESVLADDGRLMTRYPVASQLAKIARAYGFDGWLMNIEKTIPSQYWSADKMCNFLNQLRSDMPAGHSVMWYDALTVENEVIYQNSMTMKNLPFFEASNSILTNYHWDPVKVRDAHVLSKSRELDWHNVNFGVDVWAQTKRPEKNKRITWPEEHGGGTRTSLAVKELARSGCSVGIFGPAMAYQHFGQYGKAVDETMWFGVPLPEDLRCDCGEKAQAFHPENIFNGIAKFAKSYTAGSAGFLYTNFERAFEVRGEKSGLRAHVGAQSVLPNIQSESIHQDVLLRGEVRDGRFLITTLSRGEDFWNIQSSKPIASIQLFKIDMTFTQPIRIRIKYSAKLSPNLGTIKFFLTQHGRAQYIEGQVHMESGSCVFEAIVVGDKLAEDPRRKNPRSGDLGVYLFSGQENFSRQTARVPIVEIHEISMQPADSPNNKYSIRNIQVAKAGIDDLAHRRLTWDFQEQISKFRDCAAEKPRLADGSLDQRPWSDTTGPFSYFKISVDGEEIGRAYALQFILPEHLAGRLEDDKVIQVKVIGVTFWGDEFSSEVTEIPNLAAEWEMVDRMIVM